MPPSIKFPLGGALCLSTNAGVLNFIPTRPWPLMCRTKGKCTKASSRGQATAGSATSSVGQQSHGKRNRYREASTLQTLPRLTFSGQKLPLPRAGIKDDPKEGKERSGQNSLSHRSSEGRMQVSPYDIALASFPQLSSRIFEIKALLTFQR